MVHGTFHSTFAEPFQTLAIGSGYVPCHKASLSCTTDILKDLRKIAFETELDDKVPRASWLPPTSSKSCTDHAVGQHLSDSESTVSSHGSPIECTS